MFTFLRSLVGWFRPTIDALSAKNITFAQRWRMLLFLQLAAFITYPLASYRWIFSRPFTVEFIPIAPGRSVRVLIFKSDKPKSKPTSNDNNGINDGGASNTRPRPLHLDIHGGGFMGGIPESDAPFCAMLAAQTGAVVISTTYRFAPAHVFPAAIDDIDALVRYLHAHAAARWGANPELMTISGFSAGGNLAVAASQQESAQLPAKTALKASVTYYGVMELRLKPEEKAKPARFPKRDPAAVLFPLMDAYAGPVRAANMTNPRLSPVIATTESLPRDMLFVVPSIDILVKEQLDLVERVRSEIERDESQMGRRVEALVIDEGFHGWVELPDRIAGPTRIKALQTGVDFLKEVYKKHGWEW